MIWNVLEYCQWIDGGNIETKKLFNWWISTRDKNNPWSFDLYTSDIMLAIRILDFNDAKGQSQGPASVKVAEG